MIAVDADAAAFINSKTGSIVISSKLEPALGG
jgi:hypothetical protein